MTALTFLKDLDATKPRWKKLPPTHPWYWADRWVPAVCPIPGVIDHRMCMFCFGGTGERLSAVLGSAFVEQQAAESTLVAGSDLFDTEQSTVIIKYFDNDDEAGFLNALQALAQRVPQAEPEQTMLQ